MKLPKKVEVHWRDAASLQNWATRKELHKISKEIIRCRTIGYLISEDGKNLIVSSTIGWKTGDEMMSGSIFIPKSQIELVREIPKRGRKQ